MEAVVIIRNRCSANIKWLVAKLWVILAYVHNNIFHTYQVIFSVFGRFVKQNLWA
jgi:hypothetical protein